MNFGKMDGKIQGYMKEAVLQASLPTQYDFRLELAPKKGDRIEFSPQAMRNFIRTFAGESIDRIPGIVNWIAFGWPAQFLGFFNIEYAGIALLSKDGFIQVKTLKEGEPYVLKGFRIKVPLKAPRTPLIVDAYAMGQFVSQLKQRLMNLSEEGASAGAEPQFLIDGADRQGALKSRQSDGSCFTPGF